MNDSVPVPDELGIALRTLLDESIGDFVYQIRDRELKGWDGPRVAAWSEACRMVEKYAAPPVEKRLSPDEVEIAELEAERTLIDNRLRLLRGGET